MPDRTAEHLAANVKRLREARGLTQQRLAKVSGVPRPTVANLESGTANPTLAVLIKMAAALQVTIEQLIGPPRRETKVYRAGSLPARVRGQALVRKLLPDPIPGMEIERIEVAAGGKMTGTTRAAGAREYVTCEAGEIDLTVSGGALRLQPGDVAVVRGDQKHSYANPGRRPAVVYTVVTFAPVG